MSSRRASISRPARARRGRRKHVRQAADRLQVDAQSARHRIPDARRPGETGSRLGARMAAEEGLRGDSRRQPRAAALRPARRPTVRQRRHPYRPRRQQDPQGHRRQEQAARRLRRAVRAGMGLPRHADRGADRKNVRQKHTGRGNAAAGTRLRDRADRAPESAVPAARRARRLGSSLYDHGVWQRSRRNSHARRDSRQGLHLSRSQAGQLVLRLPVGAGRSRSRIRGSHRRRRGRSRPIRRWRCTRT